MLMHSHKRTVWAYECGAWQITHVIPENNWDDVPEKSWDRCALARFIGTVHTNDPRKELGRCVLCEHSFYEGTSDYEALQFRPTQESWAFALCALMALRLLFHDQRLECLKLK